LPAVGPVTVTLNTHWLLMATLAPDRAMPVGAVVVSVPPHTLAEELATVSPAGSVSVNATPVSATVLAAGLVMVNCNEVVAFSGIVVGLKALVMDGGATTVSVAVFDVEPVPPSVEVITLVVLFFAPAAAPVTFTKNVQELLAAIVPPARVTDEEPAVAVMVPLPQPPDKPLGEETTRPAGKVSLKLIPVSVVVALGLVSPKLIVDSPFKGMEIGENAFEIVGGATTVILAFEVLPVPPSVEVT
jgi:hypothetical protein